jgi:hypothetical protein
MPPHAVAAALGVPFVTVTRILGIALVRTRHRSGRRGAARKARHVRRRRGRRTRRKGRFLEEKFTFDEYEYRRIHAQKFVEWHARDCEPHPPAIAKRADIAEPEPEWPGSDDREVFWRTRTHANEIRRRRRQATALGRLLSIYKRVGLHDTPSARRRAISRVHYALRTGLLLKPTECERCGVDPGHRRDGRSLLHGHHHDYSKPLSVEWLCADCHQKWHAGILPA